MTVKSGLDDNNNGSEEIVTPARQNELASSLSIINKFVEISADALIEITGREIYFRDPIMASARRIAEISINIELFKLGGFSGRN